MASSVIYFPSFSRMVRDLKAVVELQRINSLRRSYQVYFKKAKIEFPAIDMCFSLLVH